jgi:hypothetical protein
MCDTSQLASKQRDIRLGSDEVKGGYLRSISDMLDFYRFSSYSVVNKWILRVDVRDDQSPVGVHRIPPRQIQPGPQPKPICIPMMSASYRI